MILSRSNDIKNDRAQVHADALDDGVLLLYTGTIPSSGGAITDQVLLCTLQLPSPAGSVALGIFTLDSGVEAIAVATGVAAWARVKDGFGAWVMDMDVGASGSGAAIIATPVEVFAGGTVRINQFRLIES